MKKRIQTSILILAVALGFHNQGRTQDRIFNSNSYLQPYYIKGSGYSASLIRSLKIKELEYKYLSKKGHFQTVFKEFDINGRMVKSSVQNAKGKITEVNTMSYNEKGELLEITSSTKKTEKRTAQEYSENGKCKEIRSYENGVLKHRQVRVFNEKGLFQGTEFYNSKGLYNKTVHLYNDDNKLIRIEHYNGKNQLTKAYDYSCEPTGNAVNPKEQKKMCLTKSSDGEFYFETTETLNEKGEMTRRVAKFSIQDTSLLEGLEYNKKDELYMHILYNGSFYKPTKSLIYNKGKITQRKEYTYDSSGRRTSEEIYHKEKLSWKKSWEYENGLCVITEHRDALHRIRMSSALTILAYH